AILRATGRIFLGLGPPEDPLLSPEPDEEREVERDPARKEFVMVLPAAVLILAGLGLSLVPGIEPHVEHAADMFIDRPAYAAAVLHGHPGHESVDSLAMLKLSAESVIWSLVSIAGSIAFALFLLY